jgi:hypothetical protein
VAQFASALDRGVAASDAAAFGAALAEPIRTEPATDERRKRTVIEIDFAKYLCQVIFDNREQINYLSF